MTVNIQYRLSGGAGNSSAAASLGGAMSSSANVSASLNAFFDLVSSAEAVAGDTEYRCIYVANIGTSTALGAKLWIQSNTPNTDNQIAIALGGEGLNGTAETVANENTAPAGETFSEPASEGAALSLGDLAQNDEYPVWIRRTINAGAAADASEQFTLRVKYDFIP
jgi:hypothetical protein